MSLEGLQLGHRYNLQRLIGRSMSEVYLAEDTRINNRQLAVKMARSDIIPYPDSNANKDTAERFQREVMAIGMLHHPHILPLFDSGEDLINDSPITYLVMPFCPNGSLATWMQQRSVSALLSPPDIESIVSQAADALQNAHDRQIVHRDVKPSNFLIFGTLGGNPNRPNLLLADFGIAKFTASTRTTSGTIAIGTPTYMAPEQWNSHPTSASDQYSLAIMAYELMTGRPPFYGNLGQLLQQHLNAHPQAPSIYNPNISKKIDNVILRALAKNPKDRFPSVSAFAQAFQQAVNAVDPPSAQDNGDIRATLWFSATEAVAGCSRTVTLPGGRQLDILIPAGVHNGQILRLEGLGEKSPSGGPVGTLIITIAIKQPFIFASILKSLETYFTTFNSKDFNTIINHLTASKGGRKILSAFNNKKLSAITKGFHTRRGIATLLIGLAALIVLGSIIPISTNIASRNPYPPNTGTLALNDSMSDNSSPNKWDDATIAGLGTCGFEEGKYHVIPLRNHEISCYPENVSHSKLVNFVFEVQMTFVKGDGGGIVFRFDQNNGTGYGFFIGEDRSYYIQDIYSDYNSKFLTPANSFDQSINTDLGQSILIAVVANGNHLDFYANHEHLYSTTDRTWSQGQIGVAAYSYNNPTEIAFSNAKLWTL